MKMSLSPRLLLLCGFLSIWNQAAFAGSGEGWVTGASARDSIIEIDHQEYRAARNIHITGNLGRNSLDALEFGYLVDFEMNSLGEITSIAVKKTSGMDEGPLSGDAEPNRPDQDH